MTTDESFIVTNKKDKATRLKTLVKKKQLINVRFDKHSFISTVIDVDYDNNLVVFDYGSNEELNQLILQAISVDFETDFEGIKVHFVGSHLEIKDYQGEPAFYMQFPDSIYWKQRRKFYRVKSPMSKASYCEFEWKPGKRVKLRVFDISLSGFSMVYDLSKASEPLQIDARYKNSRLVLQDHGQGVVAFVICNQFPLNHERPDKIQKVGCRFTDINRHFESSVQRYMQQVERESRHGF